MFSNDASYLVIGSSSVYVPIGEPANTANESTKEPEGEKAESQDPVFSLQDLEYINARLAKYTTEYEIPSIPPGKPSRKWLSTDITSRNS